MKQDNWIVLARRPLGESDYILELFSQQKGILAAILRSKTSTYVPDILDLGSSEFIFNSQSDSNLPMMKMLVPLSSWHYPDNVSERSNHYQKTLCALYICELLKKILPSGVSAPKLFETVQKVLEGMYSSEVMEPWLRLFEYELLNQCGYSFCWHIDHLGEVINVDQYYSYWPGVGFKEVKLMSELVNKKAAGDITEASTLLHDQIISDQSGTYYAGQDLLALSENKFTSGNLAVAKSCLRLALDEHIDRLTSRELMHYLRTIN